MYPNVQLPSPLQPQEVHSHRRPTGKLKRHRAAPIAQGSTQGKPSDPGSFSLTSCPSRSLLASSSSWIANVNTRYPSGGAPGSRLKAFILEALSDTRSGYERGN